MRRRVAEFAAFVALAAVAAGWVLSGYQAPRPTATAAAARGAVPGPAEVREEVERKALEYARIFLLPGLRQPASAQFPRDQLRVRRTHRSLIEGQSAERWECTGVMEGLPPIDGQAGQANWEISIAFKEGRFYPLRVSRDGATVVEPNPRLDDRLKSAN